MLGKKHIADSVSFIIEADCGVLRLRLHPFSLPYTLVHGMDAAACFYRSPPPKNEMWDVSSKCVRGVPLQVVVLCYNRDRFHTPPAPFPPDFNSEQINLCFSSLECWNSLSVSKTEVTQISVHLKALLTVLLSHRQKEKNINTMAGAVQSWWCKQMLWCLRSYVYVQIYW